MNQEMPDKTLIHARVVSGAGGGPDKTILNSPRYLEHLDIQTLLVYLRHPGDQAFRDLDRRARDRGVPITAIDDEGPFDLGVYRRVADLCAETHPTIWHGHDYKTNLVGLLARRRSPMILVTTVHGWVKHTWKTPLYYAVDRWCLPRYDAVVCVSPDLHRQCLELGVPDRRCHYIPNGIDLEEFQRRTSRQQAKAAVGTPEDRFVIGAVGRLSEEKGFHLLISALATIKDRWPNVELWILGEGDQEAPLQKLVDELDMQDNVRLMGYRVDVESLYEAMDLFVLSSLREGLPNVLLEAMAMELPVISTEIEGATGLIQDGQNGILVDADSVPALTQGLETLLPNRDLRVQLARAARSTVEADFSFAVRMARMAEIYTELLR